MNILFIGDIVSKPGRRAVASLLPDLIEKKNLDFVIANAENSAGGTGITPDIMYELLSYGIDIITSGNHIWKRKEILGIIADVPVLRPLNYPEGVPGRGMALFEKEGRKITVINLLGRIFMQPVDNPFSVIDSALKTIEHCPVMIVDFHADATSEKIAMGWHLDGRVSAVLGTHTHVQTADERILPNGTAYISDTGMTGSHDGVIGVEKEEILEYFINNLPFSYKACSGPATLNAVMVEIDDSIGRAEKIERISIDEDR